MNIGSVARMVVMSLVSGAAGFQEIERGSEGQRVQGLLEACSAGVVVPDTTLKT